MKKINFGLLGCGYIGTRHAKHIFENSNAILAKVFDLDYSLSIKIINEYKTTKASGSFEELLDDKEIDIISVCTPSGDHYQSAKMILEAGKHVLIEKPMTLSTSQADSLIRIGLKKGKEIFIVKQNRYNDPVQALKKLIDEKKLGKIYMVVIDCFWNRNNDYYTSSSWKGKKSMDGGTLFNQFSHFVDLMYYLFGDIENISGIISNVNHKGLIEFEDSGVFNFNFLSGALGSFNFTTAAFEKNMEGSITVFAENGAIKLGGQYLNKIDYQRTKGFDITNLPETGPSNVYGYYQGSMSNHDKVIDNVIQALNGKTSFLTNAEDGKMVVNMIERMYSASKTI